MISPPVINSYCDKVRNALSIEHLGVIFTDYPELIFSKYGIAAILQTIPKLVQKHHERKFCWPFLKAIIDAMQKKHRHLYDTERLVDQRGTSPSTWARDVLICYIGAVIDESNSDCFENNVLFPKEAVSIANNAGLGGPEEYLGFLFLLFDFGIQDGYSKTIWHRYVSYNTIRGFLNVFADCRAALGYPDASIEVFTKTWLMLHFDENDLHLKWPLIEMLEKVNVGGFCEAAKGYIAEESEKSNIDQSSIRADISDLFVHLSNTIQDDFSRESYFYEYIGIIASEYSTMNMRFDIAARYDRYFGSEAINYMADITSVIMDEFGAVTNYRNNAILAPAYARVAKVTESIILDMKTKYPEVSKRVIQLFFRDTLDAFGYGITGASGGAMLAVDAIVDTVYKQVEQMSVNDALEAINALYDAELAVAMEADGDATTEDLTKHEKAKVRPKEAMKSAERKIYAGYKKYKEAETNVDNQLSKGLGMLKKAVTGDQAAILIEGKQFSPVGFLKKALATVAIFNVSKIGAILALIVKKCMSRKTKVTERRKILQQLEEELVLVNEKIEDARGDGNREAKYALMRNKQALENAIKRIKYGIGAEQSRDNMGSQVNGYKG